MSTSSRVVATLAAVTALALGLAACGSDEEEPDGPSGGAAAQSTTVVNGVEIARNDAAAEMLPEEFRDGLKFVTSAPYPPFEYYDDNKELKGLDIDVGNAIAATLGVKGSWDSVPLEGVVPGVQSHKYDVLLADTGVNLDRMKVVDFASYFSEGLILMVPKGNPEGIEGLQSMCGRTLMMEKGISTEIFLPQTNKLCTDHGLEPVAIKQLPNAPAALLALESGQGDAVVLAYVAAQDIAKKNPEYEIVIPEGLPSGYSARNVGAGIAKDRPELTAAVTAALEALHSDGTLQELFAKYDLEDIVTPIKSNEYLEPVPFPPGTTP